jgi:hypothetical protein
LVEKTPEADAIQIRELDIARIETLRISETVIGSKRKSRRDRFQVKYCGWIRSEIAKGYSKQSLGTRGTGWKLGKVGIHGECQISTELEL